jgi:two-component system, chemotaxis family, sensor kinase CheA
MSDPASDPASASALLEAKLQQIAAELAVLNAGSDEGLIPLFALSSEILEQADLPESWVRPLEYLQTQLDCFLDEGRPVDEAGMTRFNAFSEWLNEASNRALYGESLPPLPGADSAAAAIPSSGEASPGGADCPFEGKLRELASEMGHLDPGSDEGLIPLLSISSELLDAPDLPGAWASALEALQGLINQFLDEGKPLDEAGFKHFARFHDWLRRAIEQEVCGAILPPLESLGRGHTKPPFAASAKAPIASPVATGPAPIKDPVVGADEEILVIDTTDDTTLLQEFFQESMEHLDSIEGHLLTLETQPQDHEGLAAVFRAFHTVKGVAGFLQLKPIQRLAHQVESLLDLARNHEIVLNSRLFTLILESCDQLKAMTNLVGIALDKGSVENTRFPVADLVERIETATLATQAGTLEESADASPPAGPTRDDPADSPSANAGAANSAGNGAMQAKARTIRVATERINSLMDVVGELVILESQLMQTAKPFMAGNTALQRQFSQLQRILKDLQHTSMALQMVPIKPTFQRVERIIRDLSQKFDKKIELHISGEDTELDRTVVELITDPLVHMVRNAVDHGLEDTEERVRLGKDPVGHVQLKAYHLGSSIVIELVDDGRGIDPEKIRAKAVEKGVISADAPLAREEILQLIFAAGFSTAAVLTENSGRGVGMDVVKRNVEAMRGVVTIISEVGKGTTFKVKLPLTTAIIDGLIVRVGADKFIIPTHTVQVTMRPEKKQLIRIAGTREMVVMRDKTIPLVRLNRFLGISDGESDPTKASLAIVESFGKHYAIMVDEMINKQEVVIKSLGDVLGKLPGIAGGAILGDGSIALILDPAALARHEAA